MRGSRRTRSDDHNGNRTATVDGEERRTVWEYDELDRMTLKRHADMVEETSGYDAEVSCPRVRRHLGRRFRRPIFAISADL
jgi:YD repeat-containing protein